MTRIKAKTKVQITSKDDQSATGDWADFDPKANMATLGGNVVLKQGKNVVRGTKLVIDMTTGESVIKTEAPARRNGAPVVSQDGTRDRIGGDIGPADGDVLYRSIEGQGPESCARCRRIGLESRDSAFRPAVTLSLYCSRLKRAAP